MIVGNSVFDYNGGNNGIISDESFNNLIVIVEFYFFKEKMCEDVEAVVSKFESSIFEKYLDLFVVLRGLSLDWDDNGFLIFVGGKIIDYCKMVEGVMECVVDIFKVEFDCSFKLINFKIYFVLGGELNLVNVDLEIEVFV